MQKEKERNSDQLDSLKTDHKRVCNDLDIIQERLIQTTKELMGAQEAMNNGETLRYGDQQEHNKHPHRGGDMLGLLETMKKDHDVLIDQVEALKIRNESLEKMQIDIETKCDEFKHKTSEATEKYHN